MCCSLGGFDQRCYVQVDPFEWPALVGYRVLCKNIARKCSPPTDVLAIVRNAGSRLQPLDEIRSSLNSTT